MYLSYSNGAKRKTGVLDRFFVWNKWRTRLDGPTSMALSRFPR